MTARPARSASTACWLRRVSSRARAEALGHVVERGHEEPELVARGQRQLGVVVALGDRAGAGDQILHRLDQALRGEERAVNGRDQRHQHDEGQNQHEGRLERLPQLHEVRVLRVGALHRVGQLR